MDKAINEKVFRVALVGCGVISENHLDALKRLSFVDVIALCDTKPERAESRKAEFGLNSKIYTDYEKMLKSEKLDAVHIATPHYLHAPMTLAALKMGINVFLEKPMCISRAEIDALIAAEKESTASVCVCFQNRFITAVKKAKELVEEDGGVIGAYGSVFWERTKEYYTESGWRGSYATEGGGVMINQAIHTIDMLCQFLGTPRTLRATTANHHLRDIIEVEDTCEGLINFENGLRASFYATTAFHGADSTRVYIVTKNHKIEITPPELYVDGERVKLPEEDGFVGKFCYGNGHAKLIKAFYEALATGEKMPATLETAQYAVRILLAAYKSNDREVEI